MTGVLLLNYGAPESMADVEPFLARIFAGRKMAPAVLAGVCQRYQLIGGGSPLLPNTRLQAAALEKQLNQKSDHFRVLAAMLHTPPYIGDVVREMADLGVQRIIGVSLAPFFSKNSSGAYFAALSKSCQERAVPFSCLPAWHLHGGFLQAVREVIAESRENWPEGEGADWVFTAHSLPQGEDAQLYHAQFLASVQAVMLPFPEQPYHIAYQSKGGGPVPWLEPALDLVLAELAAAGKKSVFVVPIGFVSDHLETLYDLDQAAAEQARSLGLALYRCPALNRRPLFIDTLAEAIEKHQRNEMLE